jgi:hypothetical protein
MWMRNDMVGDVHGLFLRYYCDTCLGGPKQEMRNLPQDSWSSRILCSSTGCLLPSVSRPLYDHGVLGNRWHSAIRNLNCTTSQAWKLTHCCQFLLTIYSSSPTAVGMTHTNCTVVQYSQQLTKVHTMWITLTKIRLQWTIHANKNWWGIHKKNQRQKMQLEKHFIYFICPSVLLCIFLLMETHCFYNSFWIKRYLPDESRCCQICCMGLWSI